MNKIKNFLTDPMSIALLVCSVTYGSIVAKVIFNVDLF